MRKRSIWESLFALSLVVGACTADVELGDGGRSPSGGDIDGEGNAGSKADSGSESGDGDNYSRPDGGPGDTRPDGGTQGPGDGDTGAGDGDGDGESPGDGDGDGPVTPVDPELEGMKGMLRAHNAVRAALSTNPALEPLTWSEDIAKVARAYAEKLAGTCGSLVHSTGGKYGENLAAFGGQVSTPKMAVDAWASELACYTYSKIGSADCSAGCSSCGHYTQLVWRNTKRAGCGVASCATWTYWVCNYDPPGNYLGQYPY